MKSTLRVKLVAVSESLSPLASLGGTCKSW
jgi:hypothetical protein